jgi:hypothetical protein
MHVTGTISHCSVDPVVQKRNLLGWAWSHFQRKHVLHLLVRCQTHMESLEWFYLALDKIQSKKEARKFAHFVICFPELIFSY